MRLKKYFSTQTSRNEISNSLFHINNANRQIIKKPKSKNYTDFEVWCE